MARSTGNTPEIQDTDGGTRDLPQFFRHGTHVIRSNALLSPATSYRHIQTGGKGATSAAVIGSP